MPRGQNERLTYSCLVIPPVEVSLSAGTNSLDVKNISSVVITNTTLLGLNLGGFSNGVDGQILMVRNRSTNVLSTLNFVNGAGGAAASDRIYPNGLIDLGLGINRGCMFQYRNGGGQLGWYQIV